MNTCEQYKNFIALYLEGELSDTQQAQLQQHTQICSACRGEYETAKSLAMIINDSFLPQQSDGQAAEAVLTAIKQTPARQKQSSRHWAMSKIAAGIMIAAALLIGFYAGRTSNQWQPDNLIQASYTIQHVEGTVLVKRSNSHVWQPLTIDSAIYSDDQFLSSPGSRVLFAIDEQSHIELKENSMLVLEITPDKTNLHLVHGTLDADLTSPHGPFFVTTPHGRAEALGTEFTVKVD